MGLEVAELRPELGVPQPASKGPADNAGRVVGVRYAEAFRKVRLA